MLKGYTGEELETFLHRETETKRRQTIIVTRAIAFADVEKYNTLLAKRLQLNADQQPLSDVVREVALVVRPPAVSVNAAPSATARSKLYPDGPTLFRTSRNWFPFCPASILSPRVCGTMGSAWIYRLVCVLSAQVIATTLSIFFLASTPAAARVA